MQYDKSFKEEVVRLSDEIGLKNAAAQLGVSYYTLSGCVKNAINMKRILFREVLIGSFHVITKISIPSILKRKMQNLNDPI
jgi:hypothetical protein